MEPVIQTNFLLFPGVRNDEFASDLAKELDLELAPCAFVRFEGAISGGGETKPEIRCNVGGRVCVIAWSVADTNDELMQVCQLIRALKQPGGAKRVILVCPCYPYARQDKTHGRREPINARLTADLLEIAGIDEIIYSDIHADQIEGYFTKAVVHSLWLDNIWIHYLTQRIPRLLAQLGVLPNQVKIMPPDEGAVASNYRIAQKLGLGLAVHLKKRDWEQVHTVESLGIAGDVEKCLIITRDDLLASGDSLFKAAEEAKERGAKYLVGLITHALGFDKPGVQKTFTQKLNESAVDELVVTNSIAYFYQRLLSDPELQKRVSVLNISPYFAVVLRRLIQGQTIREMMKEVHPADLYKITFVSEQAKVTV